MRKSSLSVAVAAILSSGVASAAGVTVNQTGVPGVQHQATWVQLPAHVATILIDQDGGVVHTADVQQTAAGANHTSTVLQKGSGAVGNDATVLQRRFDPDVSTVMVDQDGEGLTAWVRTLGLAGGTEPNDYVVMQRGVNNSATVDSTDSHGDDVDVNQAAEDNTAFVDIADSARSKVSVDQTGFDSDATVEVANATDADVTIAQSGVNESATVSATGANATASIDQSGNGNAATVSVATDGSATISQAGRNGIAQVDSTGGTGSATINQDGDEMEARVRFFGGSDVEVAINQLEDDANTALVTATNGASGYKANITQVGDENDATVLMWGASVVDSTIDITQADTRNTALVRSVNSSGVDIDVDQSAPGDDRDATVWLRNSSGTTAAVTQVGNDQVANVETLGDTGGMFTVDQTQGQNDAHVSSADGSMVAVDVDQNGRAGDVDVDLVDSEDVTVTVIDNATSFENSVDIDVRDGKDTGISSTQTGENNEVVVNVVGIEIGSHFDVIQNDDDNSVDIFSSMSSAQDIDISQGLPEGDGNEVELELEENTLTKLMITQSNNDNFVGLGIVQDRGSIINISQADDRNVVEGGITESRFNLDITQGNVDGDGNTVNLGSAAGFLPFALLNANETDVDIVQNGNDNEMTLDIFNDFGSTVTVTQDNDGIGHLAMVNLDDTNGGTYIINQDGGNNNSASISSMDNLQSTATINQIGGANNVATATLVNGDDFVDIVITQTNCFGCVAAGDSANPTINQ
ncbi:hypothetical protein AB833_05735 [Chromatiales bacterium (ex Bugula neritina AB1)]|nr:hypothetical protein AB833_05735 [Chromatiales bacterium (ex Bugula neritina AB1)]